MRSLNKQENVAKIVDINENIIYLDDWNDDFETIIENVKKLQENGGKILIGVKENKCNGFYFYSDEVFIANLQLLKKLLEKISENIELMPYLIDKQCFFLQINVQKECKKYEESESNTCELKSSFYFLNENDGLGKYISAFANTNGGKIVVGVNDNQEQCGISISDTKEWDWIQKY